ncbi:hypothetical protein [Paenibacillus lactis]|uniref:Uncharacterized protein n=1 Tax=Paenibacillus lactis TaxID=228574 RepID=A0ABS4F9T2_9BACL|nr:hypothetical protein [Paenibacillus lactis]MBP1892968.1 hypothetical protein [Paenibacillus lactis]HAF97560.1 hypothetical protein [Paenibacillus lactis]
MPDKYTTDILERINDMSGSDARKILAEIFIEIRSIGVGGKTEQDAFNAIKGIYRSEVVGFIKEKYDV